MSKKDLKQQLWTSQNWVNAYEENVRKVIKWQGFKVKPSNIKIFERLQSKFKECDPNLFMQANFPPYRTWRVPNKKGVWKVIKYPFPMMLFSDNSIKHYKRLQNQGIKSTPNRKETIIKGVEASLKRLDQCSVELTDFQRVWDMYIIKYTSPYLVLMLKDMLKWVTGQAHKGEIEMKERKILMKHKKVLASYEGLNIELWKIIKGEI